MKQSLVRVANAWQAPAFLIAAAVVYAVGLVVAGRFQVVPDPDVLALAVTLDLTLFVPLLFYLFLVRGRGWPAVSVVPVFLLGLIGARFVLPGAHQRFLDLVGILAIPAEILLVGLLVVRARRMVASFRDHPTGRQRAMEVFPERLRAAAREAFGSRFVADILATEISVLYYAFFGWRRGPTDDPGAFSIHRRSAYPAVAAALAFAIVAETVAVHFLVRMWSPSFAWVLSALGIYTLVWLVADAHAIRLRPIRIAEGSLAIRVGLRWSLEVPIQDVLSLGRFDETKAATKAPGLLKAVPLGSPVLRLELRRPVEAVGFYGIRRQTTVVSFTVDEPERFEAAAEISGI